MATDLPDWIAETLGAQDHFATFDAQDSGNIGFGVATARHRWFVKLATTEAARAGLARAAWLHRHVAHPTLVPLAQALRSAEGSALVYPWVEGRSLYAPAPKRRKSRSGPGRFRKLEVAQIRSALDTLYDAHLAIAAAGFVSVDFYDGSLIYDFATHELYLVDVDEYRHGAFTLDAERLPGSTRFMAPEESTRGATIDERTTVFHMARAASVLLDEGDCTGVFRGSEAQRAVAERGQAPHPEDRFPTLAAYVAAWRAAG